MTRMHHDFHIAFLPMIVAVITLTGCSKDISDRDLRFTSIPELAQHLREPRPGVTLADARSQTEYDDAHIPSAVNIPLQSVRIDGRNPHIADPRLLIVYGNSPADPRAAALAKRLLALGHRPVLLEEGFTTWRNRGLPTTSTNTTPTPPAPAPQPQQ